MPPSHHDTPMLTVCDVNNLTRLQSSIKPFSKLPNYIHCRLNIWLEFFLTNLWFTVDIQIVYFLLIRRSIIFLHIILVKLCMISLLLSFNYPERHHLTRILCLPSPHISCTKSLSTCELFCIYVSISRRASMIVLCNTLRSSSAISWWKNSCMMSGLSEFGCPTPSCIRAIPYKTHTILTIYIPVMKLIIVDKTIDMKMTINVYWLLKLAINIVQKWMVLFQLKLIKNGSFWESTWWLWSLNLSIN